MFSFFKQPPTPRIVLPNGRTVEYRIKLSARSRRVRFKLTPQAGLIVSAPTGFNRRRLEELVHKERDWIARRLQEVGRLVRPESLELRAVGESWKINYNKSAGKSVRCKAVEPGRLECSGAEALKRWLHKRGHEVLIPWLEKLSKETGYCYSKVRIRGQQTRWGSCSADGAISLNYHLLFLPPQWVRYVLIHELCHTKEMNHTRAFWSLVKQHVPDVKAARRALRMQWNNKNMM